MFSIDKKSKHLKVCEDNFCKPPVYNHSALDFLWHKVSKKKEVKVAHFKKNMRDG